MHYEIFDKNKNNFLKQIQYFNLLKIIIYVKYYILIKIVILKLGKNNLNSG
jgi:hypothetical protein